ncbi:MAG: ABC transporter ATP-binding protein, partial [Saccharofermentanales bacterium]
MSNSDNNSSRPPMHRGPMGRGPMGGHAGMMPGEKPKDFKGTLRKSFRFLRPHTAKLILIMVMAASSTVFMVVGPKIMGQATTLIADSVINNSAIDFSAIGRIVLSLLALYSVSAFFSYFQQYLMAGVAQRTVYDMRKAVDAKLKRLPLKYYDSKTHGEILSRVTNDIDTVSSTLQQVITQLITAAVTLVGVLYMMLSISWVMTLITIATVPLSAVFTMFITRRSRKYFSNQQRILGELSGHVEEMYTGHSIVKAYNREEMAKEKMTALNKELYENSRKAQFISGTMMPVMQFLGNVGYVLICVAGGLFAARRMIDIGDIRAFIQ